MSLEITEAVLKQVEQLPPIYREEFLIPVLPAIFEQDEFDHYADWVNENKFPTFTACALRSKKHGKWFKEQLNEYLASTGDY